MTSRRTSLLERGPLAMLKREDYKAIKHMNKDQMEYYLERIYQHGYEDGVKSMAKQVEAMEETAPSEGMEG